jgi:hypothetical protein
MPSTMTYANRHRREIGDTSADYPDNNDDNDDETYQDSGESDDEEEPSDSEPSSSSSSDDDSDDDSDGDKEPTINVKDTDGRDNTLDPPLVNELQQLIVMRVMTGCLPGSLTANPKYISL